MDTKFQTSFIPKKPILFEHKESAHTGGTSVLMFVSIIILIISMAGAGMTFVWKDILIKQQDSYITQLADAEKRFDTVLINDLRKANIKIDLGTQLLKKHMAVSEIFSIIGQITSDGIRFNSFEFTPPVNSGDDVKISMKGTGNSFPSIAWQSKVFGESSKYGKNKVIKNPILTDLVVDDKGKVGFSFTASVNSSDILYEKVMVEKNKVN